MPAINHVDAKAGDVLLLVGTMKRRISAWLGQKSKRVERGWPIFSRPRNLCGLLMTSAMGATGYGLQSIALIGVLI